jgi:predicted RNase H-like HicB family nuclease
MTRIRFPRRSSRYGVGKEIGGAVYVHRRYEHVLGAAIEEARKHLPPDFSYTVVKLTLANRSVSFVEVADFDTAPEPAIGTIIAVKTDGSCRRMAAPSDPFIYHHKWLFVDDDYDGFDITIRFDKGITMTAGKTYTVSDGEMLLILETAEEGGYVVTSPLDPELITEAESLDEAFQNARDAASVLNESRQKLAKQLAEAARAS